MSRLCELKDRIFRREEPKLQFTLEEQTLVGSITMEEYVGLLQRGHERNPDEKFKKTIEGFSELIDKQIKAVRIGDMSVAQFFDLCSGNLNTAVGMLRIVKLTPVTNGIKRLSQDISDFVRETADLCDEMGDKKGADNFRQRADSLESFKGEKFISF